MRLVIIESPYAGNRLLNVYYARLALRHSLALGEAPFASHLLYTQVLDDTIPDDRKQGIAAGHAWARSAELMAFYVDLGWSPGMKKALEYAKEAGLLWTERTILSSLDFVSEVRDGSFS